MFTPLLLIALFISNVFCTLPIGRVTSAVQLPSCPSLGFASGAVCTNITIQCNNCALTYAIYAVVHNCTNPLKGTVVLINGGFGTSAFDNGYVQKYLNAGLRVVQLAFAQPGRGLISMGRNNLLYSGCKPATAMTYIFQTVHFADRSKGFCAHGQSGGGDAIAFTMTGYNGDSSGLCYYVIITEFR